MIFVSRQFRRWCGLLAFGALLAALAGVSTQAHAQQGRIVPTDEAELRLSYAPVVRMASPAVVNIHTSRMVTRPSFSPFFDDPFFRHFFGDRGFSGGGQSERVQNSLGSGVIVDPAGLIVTNAHVIDGADEIRVAMADRREFAAEVVTTDDSTDLAVLRIDTDEALPYLEFEDSDLLEVGDIVLAIGNPFGVGQTVTSGIVSALARTQVGVSDYGFFIQTDAAINPGNSGGALVDMQGRLIGVNTAIFTRSGGSHGVGFAIPSNMVRLVVGSARTGGEVRRPWFGASLQEVTADIAESLGMARPLGVLVGSMHARGPAARAGLATGDVITRVDGREVADPNAFRYRLATRGIGGTAQLTVLRGEEAVEIDIPLEAAPEDPPRDERDLDGPSPFSGARIANLSPAVIEEMSLRGSLEGVVVTAIRRGSPAHQVNLQPGDIVREVNGTRITSTEVLEEVTGSPQRAWQLSIERDGRRIETVLRG
jgi:Do/DeqQ family serine protease